MSRIAAPAAPKMPIIVVLRRWAFASESAEIGDIFAFLPYIDLPYSVLEKKGMAAITEGGARRWERWDYGIENSESVEPADCPLFIAALEEGNWELVVIPAEEVDMEKHTGLREDDGHYDLTAQSLWMGDCCEWCGHPVVDKGAPCEACNAVGVCDVRMEEGSDFGFKGVDWE